jgi:hypothetical protein
VWLQLGQHLAPSRAISRHLALLAQHGLVSRETRGNSAFFRIADPAVYQLCDLVCGNIARQFERVAATKGRVQVPGLAPGFSVFALRRAPCLHGCAA